MAKQQEARKAENEQPENDQAGDGEVQLVQPEGDGDEPTENTRSMAELEAENEKLRAQVAQWQKRYANAKRKVECFEKIDRALNAIGYQSPPATRQ